ncbi:hemin ABC transporter substrate-binding protein [Paracoccus sp. (in: a-proteobacteria)]|uniref:hemin ABC transporter substrate-binding protein n=1 Tax=Paracoccus sp. TaxID=267 RepID=UPI0034CD1BF7
MMRRLALGACAALFAMPALADGPQAHPDARRILAVGGTVTEIIYAIGEQDRLIARDSSSVYPAKALDLPDVGYMRRLSAENVLSLRPDLILAEEGAGPPEAVALLQSSGIAFETIPDAADAAGIEARITAVAQALGEESAVEPYLDELRADLGQLEALNANVTPRRVLFILSLQGGRVLASGTDTAADAMIRLAGAENAVTGFSGYKPLTDEAIMAAAPDLILMMHRDPISDSDPILQEPGDAQIWSMPAIAATPAGQNHAILRMNAQYLLGFGPRAGKAGLDLHRAIYGGA